MDYATIRRTQTDKPVEEKRAAAVGIDLALMVAATAAGFFGASWSTALVIGLFLTLLSMSKHAKLARRYEDVGSVRVLALSVGATLANNVAFATITFAAGRAFAWLVSI